MTVIILVVASSCLQAYHILIVYNRLRGAIIIIIAVIANIFCSSILLLSIDQMILDILRDKIRAFIIVIASIFGSHIQFFVNSCCCRGICWKFLIY